MTLHLYGSIPGHVVAVSDSRTTTTQDKTRVIVDDDVRKAFPVTLSLRAQPPSKLVALVLVQGRATFTFEGESVTAHNLLSGLLPAPDAGVTSVKGLGEYFWSVIHCYWWNCNDCRDAREEVAAEDLELRAQFGERSPFVNPDGEYACNRHEFTLYVLGFDAGGDGSPSIYIREWVSGDSVISQPLPENRFYSSVDVEKNGVSQIPEMVLPASSLVLGEDPSLTSWLRERFTETVKIIEEFRPDEDLKQVRGIGGVATALVVSSDGQIQPVDSWPIPEG